MEIEVHINVKLIDEDILCHERRLFSIIFREIILWPTDPKDSYHQIELYKCAQNVCTNNTSKIIQDLLTT